MSEPTSFEREYYAKLIGRRITAVFWEEINDRPLPVLLLDGWDRDGNAATATPLRDPEGDGPGHLEHNL